MAYYILHKHWAASPLWRLIETVKSPALEFSICVLISAEESSGRFSGCLCAWNSRWCVCPKLSKTHDTWKAGWSDVGSREGVQAASSSTEHPTLVVLSVPCAEQHLASIKTSVADHQTENKSNIFFLRYTGCVHELAGNHDNSMILTLNTVSVHPTSGPLHSEAFTVTLVALRLKSTDAALCKHSVQDFHW